MKISTSYDFIIVGAGISGLYLTRELAKLRPEASIALAERYKGFGGRTYTYWPPDFPGVFWEMGAGRIHKSHKMVLSLLKEYGLNWNPIGSQISYGSMGAPNPFEGAILPVEIAPLARLDKEVLRRHTLKELCENVYGVAKTKKIFAPFPYNSEITILRADLALKGFLEGEMKGHEGYGVVAEGFSELVVSLREECLKRGVTLLPRHRLMDFQKDSRVCEFEFEAGQTITLKADKGLILALHSKALGELSPLKLWRPLKCVKGYPLFRIYMIFPRPAWFSGMSRVVFDNLPRYVLNINEKKGAIMISYTDNKDSEVYGRIYRLEGEKALEVAVMRDVRKAFSGMNIPDPLFTKAHYWELGASYWLPGDYEPSEMSRESMRFEKGIYVTGETFSLRQGWVEGALEQTQKVLDVIKRDISF